MSIKPAFDYASRDYSNIQRDLLRRAEQVAPLWTDRDPSDFGMMLVDLWAYMGDVIHYYIDRVSKEAFIQTATQRESVLAFANLYDYSPDNRTSAEATVYIANIGSASANIPANTKFRVFHDDRYYAFHSALDTPVSAESTVEVTVYEGKRIDEETLTSSASGLPNQRYTLVANNVVPSTVQVFVYENGEEEEWLEYSSIANIPIGVPGFVVNINPEGRVEIVFGDRANGRIPPSGTLITISYTVSSGASGNIPDNAVILFENNPSSSLVIQGMSAATGGYDGEDVENIRKALQQIIRTQDRAVTLTDYRDLTLTIGGVYDAVVKYIPLYEFDPEYFPGVYENWIQITPLPLIENYLNLGGFSVDIPQTMIDEIYELFDLKGSAGMRVSVDTSIQLIKTDISVDLVVNPRYVTNWVVRDVESALNSLFTLSNITFGGYFTTGEIYREILSIDGVESAEITVLQYTDLDDTILDPSDPEAGIPANALIRKGTFTINSVGGINSSI